ncbi:circularly permuted type 2 ATP-grasp protein, partial [Mycobacterium tuberculosis]|nr:circularly permuted type 2 ATP-grasp protein [Mycobacterium tuberculosis]
GRERPWPLARLPIVLAAEDWAELARGVAQRAALLERILADLNGSAQLVADGALPAALVAGNPEFLRPLAGAVPRSGRYLSLYAVDVSRGPDGRWW